MSKQARRSTAELRRTFLLALARGLPACLAACGILLVAGFAWFPREGDNLEARYQETAASAWQAKDYELAEVCYQRLALLNPADQNHPYQLALVAEARGDLDRAAGILSQLAPTDRVGYAPAHLRQAQQLVGRKDAGPAERQLAELHLKAALQADPQLAAAHLLLGRLLSGSGRESDAEPHLRAVVDTWPELHIVLARYYARREETRGQAHAQVLLAVQHFRPLAENDVNNHPARLAWAEALVADGNFAGAMDVLDHGTAAPDNPLYQRALEQVYLRWAETDPTNKPEVLLGRLEQGLQREPANAVLLEGLLVFSKRAGSESDKARRLLEALLVKGNVPGTVHLLLGMDSWQAGDRTAAIQHLEQALHASPQAPVIVNNLAWMLSHKDPPEHARALELIESVLRQWPEQPRYRNTRGHILARLGRWKEAIPDLEMSLTALPDAKETHQVLADAYQHLGMADLAARHRGLAQAPGERGH